VVFKGAMSKLAGRKRPLDAAEKAINTNKKKIKGPDVRTACSPSGRWSQAVESNIVSFTASRRSWSKWTSCVRW